jgi:hypothetical protein
MMRLDVIGPIPDLAGLEHQRKRQPFSRARLRGLVVEIDVHRSPVPIRQPDLDDILGAHTHHVAGFAADFDETQRR